MQLSNGKLQFDDNDVLYDFKFQNNVDAERSSACILRDSQNASFKSNYQTLQNRVKFEELIIYFDEIPTSFQPDNFPQIPSLCSVLARVLSKLFIIERDMISDFSRIKFSPVNTQIQAIDGETLKNVELSIGINYCEKRFRNIGFDEILVDERSYDLCFKFKQPFEQNYEMMKGAPIFCGELGYIGKDLKRITVVVNDS